MSGFRVTGATQWTQLHADMMSAAVRRSKVMGEASSGLKVRTVGDAPTEAATVLRLDEQSSQLESFAKQASDANAWLASGDTAMQSISNVIGEALGVAKAAQNGSLSDAGREALAGQLEALADHLFELGSTTHLGRPVFGGFGDVALARDAAGVVTWEGTPGEVLRKVAPTVTVAVNVDGAAAFGFAGGDDVFTVLRDAAAAVRAVDAAGMSAASLRLEARHTDALTTMHKLGATQQRVEAATGRREATQLALAAARSDIVDIDVPKAVMDMQLAEDGYNAVLAAISRTSQMPSLAELLR